MTSNIEVGVLPANSIAKNPLLIKILAVILLVLLCYNLSEELLFWTLCKRQDRNIPPNTEILVSAYKRASAIGVPGGEVLFVYERSTDKIYLLDLRTGEKRDVPNDPLLRGERVVFLSPELAWLIGAGKPSSPNYRPHYILDFTNEQRYELLDLTLLPGLKDGEFNPDNYAYIQSAENVFIHPSENELIALSTNFRTNQNGRVIFSGYAITTDDDRFLENLMRSWEMDYRVVDLSLDYADVPSPTGKYVARKYGIYLSRTNKKVVGTPGYFKGWYYDESGVVVQEWTTSWIRSPWFGAHYTIYNPILKLRLPAP
jgi:hypothetical protein